MEWLILYSGRVNELISYRPNVHEEGQYSFCYSSLRLDYQRYAMMSDEEFVADVLNALHFACYVCFIKEIGSDRALGDDGVVHELLHILIPDTRPDALKKLPRIRDTFNRDCCLA